MHLICNVHELSNIVVVCLYGFLLGFIMKVVDKLDPRVHSTGITGNIADVL